MSFFLLQVKTAVMIDRPEPPPTHMAVAIVPFQVWTSTFRVVYFKARLG